MQAINFMRFGGSLALGACVTLAACQRSSQNAYDTTAAGGEVATADTGYGPGGVYKMPKPAMTDENIVGALVTANATEVDIGKYARDHATAADVKAFARMMVRDHERMLASVHQLASKLKITSHKNDKAEDMKDKANDAVKDLRDLKGKDFDKKYMDEMVDAHQKTLNDLNDMRKATSNADLQKGIDEAIPKVQAHLDRAKKVKDALDH